MAKLFPGCRLGCFRSIGGKVAIVWGMEFPSYCCARDYKSLASFENGFTAMTVIDVSVLGHLADERQSKLAIEFSYKYSKLAKIELVCSDKDVNLVVDTIQKNGCTYQPGDGIIFVSPIERAVKIRTCEEGDAVLQS